ncbi:hypothetical protein FB451DRAFT_1561355, partial [Mycena latifolia]
MPSLLGGLFALSPSQSPAPSTTSTPHPCSASSTPNPHPALHLACAPILLARVILLQPQFRPALVQRQLEPSVADRGVPNPVTITRWARVVHAFLPGSPNGRGLAYTGDPPPKDRRLGFFVRKKSGARLTSGGRETAPRIPLALVHRIHLNYEHSSDIRVSSRHDIHDTERIILRYDSHIRDDYQPSYAPTSAHRDRSKSLSVDRPPSAAPRPHHTPHSPPPTLTRLLPPAAEAAVAPSSASEEAKTVAADSRSTVDNASARPSAPHPSRRHRFPHFLRLCRRRTFEAAECIRHRAPPHALRAVLLVLAKHTAAIIQRARGLRGRADAAAVALPESSWQDGRWPAGNEAQRMVRAPCGQHLRFILNGDCVWRAEPQRQHRVCPGDVDIAEGEDKSGGSKTSLLAKGIRYLLDGDADEARVAAAAANHHRNHNHHSTSKHRSRSSSSPQRHPASTSEQDTAPPDPGPWPTASHVQVWCTYRAGFEPIHDLPGLSSLPPLLTFPAPSSPSRPGSGHSPSQ